MSDAYTSAYLSSAPSALPSAVTPPASASASAHQHSEPQKTAEEEVEEEDGAGSDGLSGAADGDGSASDDELADGELRVVVKVPLNKPGQNEWSELKTFLDVCHVMSCHVMSCHVVLGWVGLGYAASRVCLHDFAVCVCVCDDAYRFQRIPMCFHS